MARYPAFNKTCLLSRTTLRRISASLLRCATTAVTFLFLVGCGGIDHGNRVAISGTVTKNGAPIQYANIVFEPIEGKSAQGGGGTVVKGKYNLSRETGPTPGQKYKITLLVRPAKFAPGSAKNSSGPGDKTPDGGAAANDKPAEDKPETLEKTIEIPAKISGPFDIDFT